MRSWHVRPFRHFRPWRVARRTATSPRKGNSLLISAVLGIGLALLLIYALDARLRPTLSAMATAKVTNEVTQTLDGAIAECTSELGISYNDVITIEKDSSGHVTVLTSNMALLNNLRTGILSTVTDAVDTMNTENMAIPMGNLTGMNFFSGIGLSFPVEVVSVGSAHATFENAFSSAGINQTRHQILLNVTVIVDILLPSETIRTDVSAQVPIAETVIVGTVPNTYLELGAPG